ncbi:uncharacterized protein VTP21DRAFT_3341 [Calcarisporiella thermophila]|uniref:uncharacterized protein n=1 Tax=Calcarisporiella thermophila TaxID=911321 RepID=UPI00374409D1
MRTFFSVTLLLALANYALCDFYFTQPITGTVWEIGTTQLVTWTNGTSGPQELRLVTGDPKALQLVYIISTTVDGGVGSYNWTIPTNLTSSKYALTLGKAPNVSYSPLFTINDPKNPLPSSSGEVYPAASPSGTTVPTAAHLERRQVPSVSSSVFTVQPSSAGPSGSSSASVSTFSLSSTSLATSSGILSSSGVSSPSIQNTLRSTLLPSVTPSAATSSPITKPSIPANSSGVVAIAPAAFLALLPVLTVMIL